MSRNVLDVMLYGICRFPIGRMRINPSFQNYIFTDSSCITIESQAR